jgi:hypothetical protein
LALIGSSQPATQPDRGKPSGFADPHGREPVVQTPARLALVPFYSALLAKPGVGDAALNAPVPLGTRP